LENDQFAPYGIVIPMDNDKNMPFDIKLIENSFGWRIAILEITSRTTRQLHCHPDSLEVFEPVRGSAVLLVSSKENPECIEAFLLDKPVCVNKGIWHSIIALSTKATLKITENAVVTKEIHDIGEVKPVLISIK
jgi:ureidoglycolate hydrolase